MIRRFTFILGYYCPLFTTSSWAAEQKFICPYRPARNHNCSVWLGGEPIGRVGLIRCSTLTTTSDVSAAYVTAFELVPRSAGIRIQQVSD